MLTVTCLLFWQMLILTALGRPGKINASYNMYQRARGFGLLLCRRQSRQELLTHECMLALFNIESYTLSTQSIG